MKVPTGIGTSEIEIKKSRFLGHAGRFDDPDGLKHALTAHRKRHPGCNHVAYAFLTGLTGGVFGMSDDREPRGTAGRPILEVVKGSGITNVLVMVVRYFGGTKLGTGGLSRAYSEAAKLSISELPVEEHVERLEFEIAIPYGQYQPVTQLVDALSGSITEEEFLESVNLMGLIPVKARDELIRGIRDLSGGKLSPTFAQSGSSEL